MHCSYRTSPTNESAFVLVCLQMHGLASLVARSVTALPPLTPSDAPKSTAKPRYCCSVCSKLFTTSSGLQIHEDGHLGRYRYRCTFCGKGFAVTSNLRGHMSLHTGVIKFKCAKCGRKIRYEGDYRRHLTVCHAVLLVLALSRRLQSWRLPSPLDGVSGCQR